MEEPINKVSSSNAGTNLMNKLKAGMGSKSKSMTPSNSFLTDIKNSVENIVNTEKIGDTINSIKEGIVGQNNYLSTNYILLVSLVMTLILVILLYLFSNSYRTSSALTTIGAYYQYQTLTNYNYTSLNSGVKLVDCYINSSYNSANVGWQQLDYVNELMLPAILKAGARYIDLTIFNSEFGINASPVVSCGFHSGEWKMTLNTVSFDNVCNLINMNAFVAGTTGSDLGVPNPEDPLFIGLNLNTNSNLYCLDKIADIILHYFRKRLVDVRYSFQQENVADMTLNYLKGKVVIFASNGFQGSKLEELVNYSWDNSTNMQRILCSSLTVPNFNMNKLIEYNKTGITIVIPHQEGDILTSNYDPTIAWKCGCQFVAENFQYIDSSMDIYITTFKNNSLKIKPKNLLSSKVLNS
jgi:hypothetical protein